MVIELFDLLALDRLLLIIEVLQHLHRPGGQYVHVALLFFQCQFFV